MNLYDLALPCELIMLIIIMTFVAHIVFFMSLVASFAVPLSSGANYVTRAASKLHALQKSCHCPICVTAGK